MRSLSAVARQLGVTHATVSRHVKRLEEDLGVELFDKTPEGYTLTEAGDNVFNKINQMIEISDQIPDAIEPCDGLAGTLKITSVHSVIDHWITPRLSEFVRQHPSIEYQVIADPRNLSLARGESHIAVRLAMPKKGELITRKLADVSYQLYGIPELIDRLETGEVVPFLGHLPGSQNIPEAAWIDSLPEKYQIVLRSNSVTTLVASAKTGLGIAVLPRFVGDQISTLKASTYLGRPPTRELWMLIRPDMLDVPRIRAFVDYLVDCVKTETADF